MKPFTGLQGQQWQKSLFEELLHAEKQEAIVGCELLTWQLNPELLES